MKKSTLLLPFLFVLFSSLTDDTTETIPIKTHFTQLRISGEMKVLLVQNPDAPGLLQYQHGKITTSSIKNVLTIKKKKKVFSNSIPEVVLTINQLEEIIITGDVQLTSDGTLQTPKLFIDNRGDGSVELSVESGKVTVISSPKAKAGIKGSYNDIKARVDEKGRMEVIYMNTKSR